MIAGVVLVVLLCGSLAGQSKETLAAQLEAARRENAVLAAALAKVNAGGAAQAVAVKAGTKQGVDGRALAAGVAKADAETAEATAERNAKVAQDAAREAQVSLDKMKEQLLKLSENNARDRSTLLITGGFAFLGLLVPVLMAWMARAAEHQSVMDKIAVSQAAAQAAAQDVAVMKTESKETARVQDAKLDQIHVLVNSNMTASMESELMARKRGLVSLRELAAVGERSGLLPSPEAQEVIRVETAGIAELEAQLRDRLAATTAADAAKAKRL